MQEWVDLATALRQLNRDKYDIILVALREIVEAETQLAAADVNQLIDPFRRTISA